MIKHITLGIILFFPTQIYPEDLVPVEQPVPLASDQVAAPTEQTPAAPTDEVQASQLTWPDTVELSEANLAQTTTDNPAIIELFKKTSDSLDAVASSIDSVVKERIALYQKEFELDDKINDFFQNTGSDLGTLESPIVQDSDAPTPTPIDANKQNYDLINTCLETIKTTKTAMKKNLSDLDDHIQKIKETWLAMTQKGLDLLKQTSVDAAQKISQEVSQAVTNLTAEQQDIHTKITTEFQATHDKIAQELQKGQTLLDELKLKKKSSEISEEPEIAKPNPIPTVNTPSPEKAPSSSPLPIITHTVASTQQEAFFSHYLVNRMKKLMIGAADIMVSTYEKLKNKAVPPTIPSSPAPIPETTITTAPPLDATNL